MAQMSLSHLNSREGPHHPCAEVLNCELRSRCHILVRANKYSEVTVRSFCIVTCYQIVGNPGSPMAMNGGVANVTVLQHVKLCAASWGISILTGDCNVPHSTSSWMFPYHLQPRHDWWTSCGSILLERCYSPNCQRLELLHPHHLPQNLMC